MKKINKKGFTLIELLIVISIIGILAVALIPSLTGAPARARDLARKAIVSDVINSIATYELDNGSLPTGGFCVDTTAGVNSPAAPTGFIQKYFSGKVPESDEVAGWDCHGAAKFQELADGYVVYIATEYSTEWDLDELDDLDDTSLASTADSANNPSETNDDRAFAIVRRK